MHKDQQAGVSELLRNPAFFQPERLCACIHVDCNLFPEIYFPKLGYADEPRAMVRQLICVRKGVKYPSHHEQNDEYER